VVAARMEDAYEGVVFSRALAMLKNEQFPKPAVLDVLKVSSDNKHQYDLPLHFNGHITSVSHRLEASTDSMSVLGDDNGYQHLWLRARTQVAKGELFQVTWLLDNRFYTYSVLAQAPMEVLFTQTGANDPDFNLRTEPAVILRVKEATNFTFISVLEPHGEYNGSREFTTASASHISNIEHISKHSTDAIRVTSDSGSSTTLGIAWDSNPKEKHQLNIGDSPLEWSGFHVVVEEAKAHE